MIRRARTFLVGGTIASIAALGCPSAVFAQANAPDSEAEPSSPPPEQAPPPPPPSAAPSPPAQGPGYTRLPPGEWVYTAQYGWVWMPYGDAFTYVPPGGIGEPLEYVYFVPYGWVWVVAPWVWGIGPWPHFVHGPRFFVWFRHGWWRDPARWRFTPAPVRGGPASHGVRPAPPRVAARPRGDGERHRHR